MAGSNEHPQDPTYRPGDPVALLVSRTNPDRVQHANWQSETRPTIPAWLVAVAAAAFIGALALPGVGRRLQAAVAGALKNGGGRGI